MILPQTPHTSIRVALVDDHRTVLWGLQKLIQSAAPGMTVVASATCRAELISALDKQQADVVLLDLDLGTDNGLDLIPILRQRGPKVLILSGLNGADIQERAMLAGACGFLVKSEPAEVILRAIECVQQGEIWLNRSTTAKVMTSLWKRGNGESTPKGQAALTPAERKVIAAVTKYRGAPNKVLADTLHISAHTLRNHLVAIYEKLGVHKRVELVFYAIENGLDAKLPEPQLLVPGNSTVHNSSHTRKSHGRVARQ
jgi:DNA-binding NarL/FixJ family response regulator